MKERFTISMDSEILSWIDDLITQRIFSNRSHALEFCAKQMSMFSLESLLKMHLSGEESNPVILSSSALEKADVIKDYYGLDTQEEAIKIALSMMAKSLKNEQTQSPKPSSKNPIPNKHSRIKTDS